MSRSLSTRLGSDRPLRSTESTTAASWLGHSRLWLSGAIALLGTLALPLSSFFVPETVRQLAAQETPTANTASAANTSKDTAGKDTAGKDTAGKDTAGKDTAGKDTGKKEAVAALSPEQTEFFERQVRPLLAEHCYSCHGKGQKKGGLSLDSREALQAGGDSGAVVQAGKPTDSLLFLAVTYDSATQMPPSGKLAEGQIAILRKWVEMGAPFPPTAASDGIRVAGAISDSDRGFWSFTKPQRWPTPAVADATWSRGPVDRFAQAAWEREALHAAPDADRATLARRLAIDLTGLPLAADDVDEFLAATGPDAESRLVDRLLASPRLGERWGRHWLDLARFGEDQAHTFQARNYPEGYRYRDWVVNAFNADMPYDEFARHQIAGDLLGPAGQREHLPALGFFALGPVYYADAGCAPKALADEWDDRIDTLCRGFLGLTAACARCHDHKFDPISVRDYYGLAGIFASTRYEELPLAGRDVVDRYNAAQAAFKEQEKAVNDLLTAESRALREAWSASLAKQLVASWTVLNKRKTDGGFAVAELAKAESLPPIVLENWLKLLASDQLAKKPLLKPWQELIAAQDPKIDLSADAAARSAAEVAAGAVARPLLEALAKRRELDAAHAAALAAATDDAARSKIAKPALEKPLAELIRDWIEDDKSPLAVPRDKVESHLTEEAKKRLVDARVEQERRKLAIGPKYPVAHGLADADAKNLKIHLRGDHKKLGDEAPRRFFEVLSSSSSPPIAQGSGRKELALAVASRDNPLTARVFVNRVWMHLFGRGLVSTPSNFGTLGARPTHPELLDDLAVRFMDNGWSMKWLQRELLLSRTYGLSAARSADNMEKDPDNRWLARANRRRLDVEAWRDSLMHAAGLLDLRLGGPGEDLASGNHRRRTLYSRVSRHELNPMLRLFDFPDPNVAAEQRTVTTVPLQQLFVLNSDFMLRPARELASRLEREFPQDHAQRVRLAYRAVFAREPATDELALASEFLAIPSGDGAKLSPLVQYCQALLAANELQFVD